MIEKRLPLQIPPGLVMNGTQKEREGRWIDGDLVRFANANGAPEPIGNASVVTTTPAAPGGTPRGAFAWYNTNGGGVRVVVGTSTNIYVITGYVGPLVTTITPAAGVGATTGTYSFDNIGDKLFITRAGAYGEGVVGPVWTWNVSPGGVAAPIANFTTEYGAFAGGVVVTPQLYPIVIVGNDVKWPMQTSHTTWHPTSTNDAGALTVPTSGKLSRGLVVRGQTILFCTTDLWSLDYLGGDLVYGISPIAESCGLVGSNCVVAVGGTAYWMGTSGFFEYDGFVRPLQCDIADYIFSDISLIDVDFFFAVKNEPFNEIWWFYSPLSGGTPTRAAIYNYVNKTWSKATFTRAAGIHSDLTSPFYMFTPAGSVMLHEIATSAPGAFIESGQTKLDQGDNVFKVQKVYPDGAHASDTITLYSKLDDGLSETANVLGAASSGAALDTRFVARKVRYKQTLANATSRVGVPELGVIAGGTR